MSSISVGEEDMTQKHVLGMGYGGLGGMLLRYADDYDGNTVTAVYDPALAQDNTHDAFREDFPNAAAYSDTAAEDILDAEDVDAAIVASPHAFHYDQTKTCLENGVDVLVEKPMVTDTAHAQDLVETADEYDTTLHVGFQRHLDPAYQTIRDTIDDGTIGEIEDTSMEIRQPGWMVTFLDAWRADSDLSGGGELYDSGQHPIDALIWATDTTPTYVETEDMAFVDEYATLPDDDPANRDRVDVVSEMTLGLAPDSQGDAFEADIAVYGVPDDVEEQELELSIDERLEIQGTEGTITYDNRTLTVDPADGEKWTQIYTEDDVGYLVLNRDKVTAFSETVHNPDYRTDAATGVDGLTVTAVTEAAYESHESGERVDVADDIRPYL